MENFRHGRSSDVWFLRTSFMQHIFSGLLRWAALFLGELRDGLTMINMQSAFLIVSKNYSEKQAGILFFGTWHVGSGQSA